MNALLLPLAALALDLALGDPHSWPHPVRFIGWGLDRLERLIQPFASPAAKRLLGLLVTLSLSLGICGAVSLLARIPAVGWLVSLYLAYAGLALGQLVREARAVSVLIGTGRLEEARQALSMLVSRETAHLDEAGLWRTLAETVSENFCDAFVAPYFYLCLGGTPLLWLYKTTSTMDSMWGYKTSRFKDLGWAGARADDILAFLPARLAGLSLIAAGAGLKLPAKQAWGSLKADARKMASPNAGWPMAASAWLCGASMGGPAVYFGRAVEKPRLGPQGRDWNRERFDVLERLLITAGFVLMALFPLAFGGFFIIFS